MDSHRGLLQVPVQQPRARLGAVDLGGAGLGEGGLSFSAGQTPNECRGAAIGAACAVLVSLRQRRRCRRAFAGDVLPYTSSTPVARRVPQAAGRKRRGLAARQVFDRFREDAITAIYCAQEEALRQSYGTVCTELIVFGLLSEEQKGSNRVAKAALVRKGITREALKPVISDLAALRGRSEAPRSGSLPFSENTKLLFDTSNAETPQGEEVGGEQLLLALSQPAMANCGAVKMLAGLGLSSEGLRVAVQEEMSSPQRELAAVGAAGGGADDKQLTLDEVATDLTQMARDGLLDPVVGRSSEMERIIQILLRKRKNNACLVGPPGVGKTAVVEGLAQLIVEGKVPSRLRGKRLYSLDLGQLVAGTKYRGEFEDRLKKVINEVTSDESDVCLFIDEIHQLVGAGVAGPDSSMDAANLLKPALARGELQVIGATTADEYAKHVEKDAALERRFQRVACEEPSVAETVEVLEGLRPAYEEHHGVLLAPEALAAAARLSSRYITDRFLPDKAVDLIDEASSVAQWRAETELEEANSTATAAEVESKPLVTASDVARVLSKWSGIPLESIGQDEAGRLLRLEEHLARRVVGQDEAVSALARAVRRARSGMAGEGRPTATFYFAGPTGVGKTELCRVLAEEYYADAKALVRLDMSEYSEGHSVSRLVGPPPGYVGYDDPRSGQLTEAVRRRPYSVVVLDEIEKAHPEVLNMLLQVLEDGRLTDGKGRLVNFCNCIIVMTSNVGSKEILQQAQGSSGASYASLRAAVQLQLEQKFRPEFLNRIDELLIFRALGASELSRIVQLLLKNASARASAAHSEASSQRSQSSTAPLDLAWTASLEKAVLSNSKDAAYGARPLRRAVQRLFEDAVAELIISGEQLGSEPMEVDVEDGSTVIRCGNNTFRPAYSAPNLEAANSSPAPSLAEGVKQDREVPRAVAVS
eukprot:TRINITY_DN77686_c0_g1_i1.p1 TRINITY_DN77686_c0_g1~~TRINITY_DN77686_c0_g1_i1.p1  ORF type:complete len:940 (-),score=259.85 TRINITY_DN77686_c0_g1_i1:78-2870(-)